MADIVLSNVVKGIIGSLGSATVQEIALLRGVKDELLGLQDTISTINGTLLDAEKKQSHNNEVKAWLKRLENAFYDADDLVDEFNTEANLRKQEMLGISEMTKQVCTFFSTSNQLAFQHKLGHKIKAIKDRLEVIRKERKFHLDETCEVTKVETTRGRETHSGKPEKEIVGRDKDKMAIMELLLDPKIEENLCVVPIVGCGGLGKTTLIKLVYNDEEIKRHFDLKMWVFVSSNDFNVRLLAEKILKSAIDQKDHLESLKMDQLQKSFLNKDLENLEMDQLHKRLQKEIIGKKCLFILDDVWNENRELWLELKGLLSKCAKGSRIIITTRSKVVADITTTIKPYILEGLDKDDSWSLFKTVAFKEEQKANNSKIFEMGMEIVEKCKGIPLAIRTIGRMLYGKDPDIEWSSFLKLEFSRIPHQEENDIIPTLKLSYNNLPSHLKHCFALCKLFPKGHEMNIRLLINLWMALGFISKSSYQTQVDVGYGYYMELLRGSFFQEEREYNNFVKKCKMHDLMHDLATQVGGTTYALLQSSKESDDHFDESTRHVSFGFHLDSPQKIPIALLSQPSKIRTVLLVSQSSKIIRGRSCQSICDAVVSSLKSVRVLVLSNLGIKVVPRCVGKLKHLRYLDLHRNENIKSLPDCITMLYNLQTLILFGCKNLQTLPRNMKSLVNLATLDIGKCKSLTHMPQGFDKLTKLQFLTHFVLKSRYSCDHQVGQLKDLVRLNLGGNFTISNLGNGEDTKNANLKEKRDVQSLYLHWRGDHPYYSKIDWASDVENNAEYYSQHLPLYLKDVDYEATLEGLQPHQNLRGLSLEYYEGIRFSSWLPSLANLEYFDILNNRNCQYLPPLNQFLSLKVLKVGKMVGLEYISDKSSSSCTKMVILPSLEEIYFISLPNLKGWWREDEEGGQVDDHSSSTSIISFPRLSDVNVLGCPKLTFLPLSSYIKYLTVGENNWKPFQQALVVNIGSSFSSSSSSFSPFSNLTHLFLYKIEDLQCLPEKLKILTSLQALFIMRCSNLKSLSPGIQHLVSSLQVLRIEECSEVEMSDIDDFTWQAFKNLRLLYLVKIPQMKNLPEGLKHVTSLQKLKLLSCENLLGIPDWISNLKSLNTLLVYRSPNLTSLPEGIRHLTSLRKLKIIHCSKILFRRCQREKGEDWPKIAHIPPDKLILKPTSNQGCNWKIFKKFQIPKFSRKG